MSKSVIREASFGGDFCIKPGYKPRVEPVYFEDVLSTTEGIIHQPEVYPFAAFLARQYGCDTIVDLGCGRANKLLQLAPEFKIIGVDWGSNIRWCREHYSNATWIEHDFERGEFHLRDLGQSQKSMIICSDVIEHLRDPSAIIRSIRQLLSYAPVAILTTPERDLVRGTSDFGPPANAHHVREWSRNELTIWLRQLGLEVLFSGLTLNNDRDRQKRTTLTIIGRATRIVTSAPSTFRVTAYVCAYNEEDIIEQSMRHMCEQGLDVHLIDNWSTDRTVEYAERFLGKGLRAISRFPVLGPSATYDWQSLLEHVQELSSNSDSDWNILYDADEVRESPWPHLRLKDAIYRVDREGFNAIDHTVIVFRPIDNDYDMHRDLSHFTHFEFGSRPGHFHQVKAWRNQSWRVNVASSAGHSADFPGRRTYPFKFLLKHYPIRSQSQGLRKVLRDRQARWNSSERERGWHIQYDDVDEQTNFLAKTPVLTFDPENFYPEFLVERLSGIGISSLRSLTGLELLT